MNLKNNVALNTRFYTRGNTLYAVATLIVNAKPYTFRVNLDLEPIEEAVRKYHNRLHAENPGQIGWSVPGWKGVKKMGRKIGRNKLLRKIHKTSKKVIKSRITQGVFVALAAFPPTAPVGVPALAAYTATLAAVTAVEEADTAKKKVKKAYYWSKRLGRSKKRIKRAIAATAKPSRGRWVTSRRRARPSRGRWVTSRRTRPSRGRLVMRRRAQAKKRQMVKLRRIRGLEMDISGMDLVGARRMSSRSKRASRGRLRMRREGRPGRQIKMSPSELRAYKTLRNQALRRRFLKNLLARRLAQSPKAKRIVKKGLAGSRTLKKVSSSRGRLIMKRLSDRKKKVMKALRKMTQQAAKGDLVAVKKLAIFEVVAQQQKDLGRITAKNKGGVTGVLIDQYGMLRPGNYGATGPGPSLLYTPSGYNHGNYQRV